MANLYKHERYALLLLLWTFIVTPFVSCQDQTLENLTETDTEKPEEPTVVTTANCGINGNTDTICSPKPGDTWKNGTWYPITWNVMYPTYVSAPTVDIYVYFVQNYQNVLIKKLPDINTSKGTVPVLVDDSWRLSPSAETYESLIYIVKSGVSPEKELSNRYSDYPPPIHNKVAQVALAPPVVTAAASPSNRTAGSTMLSEPTNQVPIAPTPPPPPVPSPNISNLAVGGNKSSQQSHTIQPGIIAAIVLGALAVLCACIAVAWIMRRDKRKESYGEKGHLVNSATSSSLFPGNHEKSPFSDSISITNPSAVHNHSNLSSDAALLTAGAPFSTTASSNKQQFGFMSVPSLPLADDNKVYMDGNQRPQSTASFSNASSRSEPPLTSTDALLIADTFRQRMRRPDWQQQQQQKQQDEKQEEDKRRQLSEALLKTELEAEGTLMKKVGKRAHLLSAATFNKS